MMPFSVHGERSTGRSLARGHHDLTAQITRVLKGRNRSGLWKLRTISYQQILDDKSSGLLWVYQEVRATELPYLRACCDLGRLSRIDVSIHHDGQTNVRTHDGRNQIQFHENQPKSASILSRQQRVTSRVREQRFLVRGNFTRLLEVSDPARPTVWASHDGMGWIAIRRSREHRQALMLTIVTGHVQIFFPW